MTTPEKKVKQRLTKELKRIGAYWFYPATGGYGRSGVPDIVGCYRGVFFGFECKAGKNKATALQLQNINQINDAGGFSIVVNEENIDRAIALLDVLADRRK